MSSHVRSILCAALRTALCSTALFLMASSSVRAVDPDSLAPANDVDVLPESAYLPASDDGCDEADDACCSAPSCSGRPMAVFVPNLTPGLELTAGWLYLKPGADNLGYATITTFLPLGNPQWAVQSLDPQLQSGFSVGARYAFAGSGNDLRINWDRLRTGDTAFVAVSDPATQWVSPFNQTGPSTSETANEVGVFHLKAAEGRVGFDFDQVNLDAGQSVNLGPNTRIRLFTGLSVVRLREQLISTFYNNPNINPVPPVIAIPDPTLRYITLNNTSTFTGLGPLLGLSTACNLPLGFTCVGQLSGALLGGSMQPAQYSFAAVFDNVVNSEQIRSRSVTQVVYASDAKLGLGYSRLLGNGSIVSIESGFRAAVFIHPFSTYETSTNVLPLDIGSLSTNSMRHTPSNFTLLGFYLTGGWQW